MAKSSEPEKPAVTLPGTVEKIIPGNSIANEKAQISVEDAEHLYSCLLYTSMAGYHEVRDVQGLGVHQSVHGKKSELAKVSRVYVAGREDFLIKILSSSRCIVMVGQNCHAAGRRVVGEGLSSRRAANDLRVVRVWIPVCVVRVQMQAQYQKNRKKRRRDRCNNDARP